MPPKTIDKLVKKDEKLYEKNYKKICQIVASYNGCIPQGFRTCDNKTYQKYRRSLNCIKKIKERGYVKQSFIDSIQNKDLLDILHEDISFGRHANELLADEDIQFDIIEESELIDNDKDNNPNNGLSSSEQTNILTLNEDEETELANVLLADEDMQFDITEESEYVDNDKDTNPNNGLPSSEQANVLILDKDEEIGIPEELEYGENEDDNIQDMSISSSVYSINQDSHMDTREECKYENNEDEIMDVGNEATNNYCENCLRTQNQFLTNIHGGIYKLEFVMRSSDVIKRRKKFKIVKSSTADVKEVLLCKECDNYLVNDIDKKIAKSSVNTWPSFICAVLLNPQVIENYGNAV